MSPPVRAARVARLVVATALGLAAALAIGRGHVGVGVYLVAVLALHRLDDLSRG